MSFGSRVRELRHKSELTQRELAEKLGVSISYICKVENDNLHFGDYPSEKFVCRLAEELQADADELMLLTGRVPGAICKLIREHPLEFRSLAAFDTNTVRAILTLAIDKYRDKALQ